MKYSRDVNEGALGRGEKNLLSDPGSECSVTPCVSYD